MLDILDGIIATAAVVLALSLVVQAIQQITKQVLSLKSTYMRRELLALFGTEGPVTLSRSLTRTVSEHVHGGPAWITKTADTLLKRVPQWGWKMVDLIPDHVQPLPLQSIRANDTARVIVRQLSEKLQSFGYKDLEMLEKVKKEDLKKMVADLTLFNKSKPAKKDALSKLDEALRDIDTWFDVTMKAFQDHYERRMKLWSIAISAVIVLMVNANLVDIYREFSTSKPRRDAALAAVPALMETAEREINSASAKPNAAPKPDSVIKHHIAVVESLATNGSFELIRWNTQTGDSLRYGGDLREGITLAASDFWRALRRNGLGWLAMTLLVSLGAPFWYDFLKTVMGVKDKIRGKTEPTEE